MFICSLIISIFYIFLNNYNNNLNDDIVKPVFIENLTSEQQIDYKKKYDDLINKYNNQDITGTIFINNTRINNLIVQTNDNEYYLNHSIEKKYLKTGSIFIDYRVNIEKDKQINIYGHNSRKGFAPFKELINYQSNEYINNNNIIYLETKNGIKSFKIFAVKITKNDEHMKIKYDDEVKWNEHIRLLRENAIYDTGDDINYNSQIIVLQTCLLDKNENFLLVLAKKV